MRQERRQPAGVGQHVGVEEGDERGRRGREPGVARGGRAAGAVVAQHPWPRRARATARRASGSADPSSTTITPPRPAGSAASRRATASVRSLTGTTTVTSRGPGPPPSATGCTTPVSSSRLASARDVASVTVNPPSGQQRASGGGEAQHARRCPAEQHPAAVEGDDVPVDDDAQAVGQGDVDGPGSGRHVFRRLDHPPIVTRWPRGDRRTRADLVRVRPPPVRRAVARRGAAGADGGARDAGGVANGLALPPVRVAGLLLVDGLGARLLQRYAADAPFLSSLPDAGPLTAGFPSSTATSLTSLGTGTPPGHHGMVGITMRVGSGRRTRLLHTLHWTAAGTNAALRPARRLPAGGRPAAPDRAGAGGGRRHRGDGRVGAAVRELRADPRGAARRDLPRRRRARRPRRRDDHRAARAGPAALLRLPRRPRRARARARPRLPAVADAALRRRPAGRADRGPPAGGRGAGGDRRPRDGHASTARSTSTRPRT